MDVRILASRHRAVGRAFLSQAGGQVIARNGSLACLLSVDPRPRSGH